MSSAEWRSSPVSAGPSRADVASCREARQLLMALGETIHELATLREEHSQAVIDGDPDSTRFDALVYMASKRKRQAKYAYIHHMETHDCSTLATLVGYGTNQVTWN